MEYLGARGTLIHEKNLKSKISCQAPFNIHSKELIAEGRSMSSMSSLSRPLLSSRFSLCRRFPASLFATYTNRRLKEIYSYTL
jgi:hypothetical protein